MKDSHSELERMRLVLRNRAVEWIEKKMFGGNCFMVDNKMCFGTYQGGMMVRVDPQETDSLLKKSGASPMIHGGRPMSGYLFIEKPGYENDKDLDFWIERCLEFNPKAKASKRK